jgi:hypothetical protein
VGFDARGAQPVRVAGGETVRRPWLSAIAILALAACGERGAPEQPASRDTIALSDAPAADMEEEAGDTAVEGTAAADTAAADAAVDSATWTAGVVDLAPGPGGVATLVSLRAARHAGYDRVVWELSGSAPGVHVEYVDRPVRQCGSGAPVPLPGDAWLEVRLEPARAHTEEGRPTIAERRRTAGLPIVLEMVQTCDFEAVVTWVLAVSSPEPFRVTRLASPPRVVVDIRRRSR